MILVCQYDHSAAIRSAANPSVVILRIYKLNHILSIAGFHNKINSHKSLPMDPTSEPLAAEVIKHLMNSLWQGVAESIIEKNLALKSAHLEIV